MYAMSDNAADLVHVRWKDRRKPLYRFSANEPLCSINSIAR